MASVPVKPPLVDAGCSQRAGLKAVRISPRKSPQTVQTLTRRQDFVRLRRGVKRRTSGFLLQKAPNDTGTLRVGFTVTKKIGNAVTRNRVKRRLRAVVREIFPHEAMPGMDYVFIANPPAQTLPYQTLLDDVRRALVDPPNPDSRR